MGASAKYWLAGRPPSLAGQLPQLDWVYPQNVGRLSGRLRGQASSHSGMGVPARDWSAVRPPSRAGLAPTVEWGYLQEIGRLSGRHREQAHSYSGMGVPAKYWSAVRPPSRASLAPTVEWMYLQKIGRLSGRVRGQASLLQWNGCTCKRLVGCQADFAGKPRSYSGMGVPARDWLAVRPPSLAGQLPQWNVGTCKRLVGCQAAFAGRPRSYSGMGVPARDWSAGRPPSRASLAPTVEWVYLQKIGRLAGRLRGQASLLQWNGCTCKRMVGCQAAFAGKPRSYSGMGVPAKDWSAGRPPSRASLAPTVEWEYLQNNGRLSGRLRGQASLLQWDGCTCKRLVGCQAAFAGKPRSYKGSVYTLRSSPLIRPSVSSPAFDLDLPAPSGGRVEAFIWGWARSAVRRSRTHREEVEAKPTGGDAPR
ncbi:hypothetical protein OU5_5776 [Pseudomonas mandelii JR-1]|uniref:Uncharacterized protein n=1 Tax=Pseudomonas mandelii JR-1 TaxID=1147786 RepID=A0A024EJX6_9PSED|nr:hypothetical protein OU5_5776 [Pseudomonas mandelii JR-1]